MMRGIRLTTVLLVLLCGTAAAAVAQATGTFAAG